MIEPALYLIPVTLGEAPLSQVLPSYNHRVIDEIRNFVVENRRSARRFLRQVNREFPIDDCTFYDMGKHAGEESFASCLQPLAEGHPVGVISEAGCPAVADPGALVVSLAQRKGYRVIPLVGPSSLLMAIMASGLNGQHFAFNGYLPVDNAERAKKLKQLESRALNEHQTQLFIETPFRNHKMFQGILRALRPTTRLSIAAGITTQQEYIHTRTIAEWKKQKLPDLSHVPAIFLIGK